MEYNFYFKIKSYMFLFYLEIKMIMIIYISIKILTIIMMNNFFKSSIRKKMILKNFMNDELFYY